jgi:superfamily II DNA or RNA helicase
MNIVSLLADPRVAPSLGAAALRWAAFLDADRRATDDGQALADEGFTPARDLVGRTLRAARGPLARGRQRVAPEHDAALAVLRKLERTVGNSPSSSSSSSSSSSPQLSPPPPPRDAEALLAWGRTFGVTALLCGPSPRLRDDELCAAAVLRGEPHDTALIQQQAATPFPSIARVRPAPDGALAAAAASLRARSTVEVPASHWIPRAWIDDRQGNLRIEVDAGDESFCFVVVDGDIVPEPGNATRHSRAKASPSLAPFFALQQAVAVEAVLDLLSWPTPDERTTLQGALRPAWTRVLDVLDALAVGAGAGRAAPPTSRIVFELVPGEGIRVRRQWRRVDRQGFSPGERLGVATLAHLDDVDEADRALARALEGFDHALWTNANLRVLAGCDRVLWDGKPATIDGGVARFTARARDDGGVVVDVAVHPGPQGAPGPARVVPPDELARWTQSATVVLDPSERRVTVVDVPPMLRPFVAALAETPKGLPPPARARFLDAVTAAGGSVPVDVDQSLIGDARPPDRRVTFRLTPAQGGLDVDVVVRPLPGAAAFPPGRGPAFVVAVVDGRRVQCARDLAAEPARARAVVDAVLQGLPDADAAGAHRAKPGTGEHTKRPPDAATEGGTDDGTADGTADGTDDGTDHGVDAATRFSVRPLERAAALLTRLHRRDDVVVEWPAGRAWRVEHATPAQLSLRVQASPTSLHVRGHVDVGGATLTLVQLLQAGRDDRRFVALADDHVVTLSDELRAAARTLAAAVSTTTTDGVRGGIGVAHALDALAEGGVTVDDDTAAARGDEDEDGGDGWARWRARLQQAAAVDDVVPAGLRASLRPYQREGLRFLRRLAALQAGGVLADDMGLGKTLQAIALLVERAPLGPQLVVAPTSVVPNWRAELARFAPGLVVRPLADEPRGGQSPAAHPSWGPGDVVVGSYGLVTRDEGALAETRFATLVLDEAQNLKNANSQRAQAVRSLVADVRVALSGTPLENHTGELWSLFSIVTPGLLPTWAEFRARFQGPIERDGNVERRRDLARLVRPFLLRRTKAEVAPELPPRTDIVVPVELTPVERGRYDGLRRVLSTHASSTSSLPPAQQRIVILQALSRLRQLACHAALDVVGQDLADRPSSKLVALRHLLHAIGANGRRALVFSQFTRLLDLVEPVVADVGLPFVRLDGSTAPEARERAVATFQGGDVAVFLLSLKAGGVGLNLTAADDVVLLDPWWNPAIEAQATDRAHRIGQTRPVTVHRLVTRDTIEDAVVQMQEKKRALFSALLDDADIGAAGLSTADLRTLLDDASAAMV